MKRDDSAIVTVSEVLRTTLPLSVPEYQRKFCWDVEKIENFYMNIFESFNEEQPVFLGTIILQREDGRRNVVDGQQRLTSLLLLILFCRFALEKENREIEEFCFINSADIKKGKMLLIDFEKSVANNDFSYFLSQCFRMSPTNKNGFEGELSSLQKKDKALGKTVMSGFKYFVDEIPKSKVLKFFTFLKMNLQANVILVEDSSKALGIFEILNTQGEPLTAFEILVPRIEHLSSQFGLNDKDLAHWKKTQSNYQMGPASERESASSAIVLSYLMLYRDKSSLGPTKQKEELYKTLRGISSKSELLKFLDDFQSVSQFYFDIWSFKHDDSKFDAASLEVFEKNSLEFLIAIKHTIVIPILCFFYSRKRAQFSNAVTAVAGFSALWRLAAQGGTNSIDQKYREAISGGHYKDIKTLKVFFKQCLKTEGIEKSTLVENVIETRFKHINLSKYLLICAFRSKVFRSGRWVIPKNNPKSGSVYELRFSSITLEHICPLKPKDKSYDQTILSSDLEHSIGNYTLLPSVFNSSISNSKFIEKRQFYFNLFSANQINKKYFKTSRKSIINEVNTQQHTYLSDLARIKSRIWSVKDIKKRTSQIVESAHESIYWSFK